MSNRTSKANRAIREAWENEKKLILEGKGSRDWTREQQQSIIDFGVAYDDNNKALEGHHKLSVEAYPEYQGDADNIQFLTRVEHKEAHSGNFQNSTNGYYDYKKEKTIIYNDKYEPNPIINLSDPIVISKNKVERKESDKETVNKVEKYKSSTTKDTVIESALKTTGDFIINNKEKFVIGLGTVAAFFLGKKAVDSGLINIKTLSDATKSVVTDVVDKPSENTVNILSKAKDIISDKVINNNYPEERSSPVEHMVKAYDRIRRGIKEHIDSYPRGGKK